VPDESPPVAIEIGWICVDCADPVALASWWQELIGGEISVDDDGDVRLVGGSIPILFLGVPDQKQVKNRLHFDLHVDDFEAAVTKATGLGASLADDVFVTERWRVLRDPEGNEFCIIRPRGETA
jgi:predicted enzyme related to lactoylglutathione lyase